MPKQDKKKKGGARRGPQSYVKKLKDSDGRIVEKLRHKKGVPFRYAILNPNKKVILECGQDYTTLEDNLSVFRPCTKPKGHDGFHGQGNGRPLDA